MTATGAAGTISAMHIVRSQVLSTSLLLLVAFPAAAVHAGPGGAANHSGSARTAVMALDSEPPPDYFGGGREVLTYEVERPRTGTQRIVIASLFGGAVLATGFGALFNLRSRAKSNEVSAVGDHTGLIYTQSLEDTRKSAITARKLSIAGYAAGGGLLVAGLVAYVVTNPGKERVTVTDQIVPTVTPLPGGAMLSHDWRF